MSRFCIIYTHACTHKSEYQAGETATNLGPQRLPCKMLKEMKGKKITKRGNKKKLEAI